MQISFLHPLFFLLLVLVPALWLWPKRGSRSISAVWRSLVFVALVTALAQPIVISTSSESFRVVILDLSESVSDEARDQLLDRIPSLLSLESSSENLSLIEVGGQLPSAVNVESGVERIVLNDPENSSDLGRALAVASAQIPYHSAGSITLVSDGLATNPDWSRAVQALIERDIPVHVVEMAAAELDVYPTALKADGELRVGHSGQVSVTLLGSGEAKVILLNEQGESLAEKLIQLNGRRQVSFEYEPTHQGFETLSVLVETLNAQDAPGNNRLSTEIAVLPPLRVLYLGDRMYGGADRIQQLVGAGFQIEKPSVELNGEFPLSNYQLVILDDFPAAKLPQSFQSLLNEQVQERGLGLLYSGGKSAFGDGGYLNTTVAELLPVTLQQRQEKREPTVALTLIIDSSGSMSGQRMELAKQVAMLSLKKLNRNDLVGIVEFYGAKNWAVPLQPLADRNYVQRAIGRMKPDGRTVLMPAIEAALYGLKNVQARHKHILVISDAGVEKGDFESIIRRASREGITLSTVMTGNGDDNEVMNQMARVGGGRFYAVNDRYSLIELNLKKDAETKLPAYQQGTYSIETQMHSADGKGWWAGLLTDELPPVQGYMEVQSRSGAEQLLQVSNSEHPLLSSWRYGLGRVTALMTEPVGPGTQSWQKWESYGAWLGRVMRRTANDLAPFETRWQREGGRVWLDVVARQRSVTPALTVGNSEMQQTLPLTEAAPGWFRTELKTDYTESVRLQVNGWPLAVPSTLSPERQVDPVHGLDLVALATATGGERLAAGQALPERSISNSASLQIKELWGWFLLAALLLYLVEIILRRLPRQ
ncbi:VWA domain-containing protein [Porticoccaceae bacterium LTM1]|nr:VWA domain-containing protein [Porticoccaceae bacterium LTM1]